MRLISLTIWLKAGYTKSANCISAIGRRPYTAAPIAAPAIMPSVSGVSRTRLVAELGPQALGGAEDAALLADVLAHDHDALVALHLLVHGRPDGLEDVLLGHQSCPPSSIGSSAIAVPPPAIGSA